MRHIRFAVQFSSPPKFRLDILWISRFYHWVTSGILLTILLKKKWQIHVQKLTHTVCHEFLYLLPSELSILLMKQVMLECAGMSQPIFVVTGSCQGIEISLDSDSVPFGAVVLGSRSTRKLIMHNTGDIGAAFNWNVEKFQPDFSISPVKGYISPGMEVSFEILFHPTVVNHDMRYEVSF